MFVLHIGNSLPLNLQKPTSEFVDPQLDPIAVTHCSINLIEIINVDLGWVKWW